MVCTCQMYMYLLEQQMVLQKGPSCILLCLVFVLNHLPLPHAVKSVCTTCEHYAYYLQITCIVMFYNVVGSIYSVSLV